MMQKRPIYTNSKLLRAKLCGSERPSDSNHWLKKKEKLMVSKRESIHI